MSANFPLTLALLAYTADQWLRGHTQKAMHTPPVP